MRGVPTEPWIKMRRKIRDDGRIREVSAKFPEGFQKESSRRTIQTLIVGALCRMWWLADEYAGEDGLLRGYTPTDLDDEVGIPGFTVALPADWCEIRSDGLFMPDYLRHNGTTAKSRLVDARRKEQAKREPEKNPESFRKETEKNRSKSKSKSKSKVGDTSPAPSKGNGKLPTVPQFTRDKRPPTDTYGGLVWRMARMAENLTGIPYVPTWARDKKTIKPLAQQLGADAFGQRWCNFVQQSQSDEWLQGNFNIPYFVSKSNSFTGRVVAEPESAVGREIRLLMEKQG